MISFLTSFPEWQIFAILFFLCIGVLPIGRLLIEGMSYNISYASAYGDIALILMALIAKEVFSSDLVAGWLSSHSYQEVTFWICACVGIVSCVVAVKTGRGWGTFMDFYHNIIIVPLLLYTLTTAIPLIFVGGGEPTKCVGHPQNPQNFTNPPNLKERQGEAPFRLF